MMAVQLCTLIVTALLHSATQDWTHATMPASINNPLEALPHNTILVDDPLDPVSGSTKATRIVLTMVDGQYKVEQEPGPFTGPNWTGTFEFQLLDDQRQIVSTFRLDEVYDELLFQHPFSLQFADYNQDGHPDFAIGQYASSNLYRYRLFTIMDDKIQELPIKPDLEIISSERSYSTLFKKMGPASFQTDYYDNSVGKSFERVYQWTGEAFERVNGTVSLPTEK